MKKLIFISMAVMAFAMLLPALSFSKEIDPGYLPTYDPVFMERSELERSVAYESTARDMTDPGKIYVKGDRIYINERYKGVHIIDNSNPENPVPVGYIVVPGCLDMAIKDDIIYLDNAVDFVAFDLTAKQVTTRLKDYFPERPSPDGRYVYGRPEGYILVGWEQRKYQE